MKILKGPKGYTTETIYKKIRIEVLKKEAYCPFCHQYREKVWIDDDGVSYIDLHKKEVGVCYLRYKQHGQKQGNWEYNIYTCKNCGAEWQGDTYFVDIKNGGRG